MDERVIDHMDRVITSQENEIAALKKRVAELEDALRPKCAVNGESEEDAKLTYYDLGISADDIFEMIERYTLTSCSIPLTKEKLAKIVQHHIVRHMDRRCRDGRTFSEVLDLRICNLKIALAKLHSSVGDNRPDAQMELEIARLEISIRNLMYVRDAAVATAPTSDTRPASP